MNSLRAFLVATLMWVGLVTPAFTQLNIPTDGSDGDLIIATNTVIDLSQAVTGVWSADNTANAGKGIYDPEKWAVVFKYSSVLISADTRLKFVNHPSHAPVVWLVNGDVTINGELDLDGESYSSIYGLDYLPEPGPGGFRGGAMSVDGSSDGNGSGFGPGVRDDRSGYYDYGNVSILPLMGGSGGGGFISGPNRFSGEGGGGAILVASKSKIAVLGYCHANGQGSAGNGNTGSSGGALRLIANQIVGAGMIESRGGTGPGRIRLEANAVSPSLRVSPPTGTFSPNPVTIWPSADSPTATVVSIDGQATPLDPRASVTTSPVDLTILKTNSLTITVKTTHFPISGSVTVFVRPRHGSPKTLSAEFTSGDANSALWRASTALNLGYSVIQARATPN